MNADTLQRIPQYEPRRPPPHWTRVRAPPKSEGYVYGGFYVITRIGQETDPEKPSRLYWWVAIEKRGHRPYDADCRRVLTAFGMETAEEVDVVKTGMTRHFMKPILEVA